VRLCPAPFGSNAVLMKSALSRLECVIPSVPKPLSVNMLGEAVGFDASSARALVNQASAIAVSDATRNDRRPLRKRFFMVLPVICGMNERRHMTTDGRAALDILINGRCD